MSGLLALLDDVAAIAKVAAASIDDVAAAEMPEFMGQHGFDFGHGEAGEQGIEEDDALVVTEAGEIGVAVAGAL